MRVLNAILLLVLVLAQAKLWFGDGGVKELRQVQRMVADQRAENQILLQRNKALALEVRDLKEGSEALEELARSELGLVGPEEEFFQIVSGADSD